jgi:hypothetical protein
MYLYHVLFTLINIYGVDYQKKKKKEIAPPTFFIMLCCKSLECP